MANKKLIIFPTEKQLKYLCSKNIKYDIYIITKENFDEQGFCVLNESNVKKLGDDVDVLCCHEESLYWANMFGNHRWNYQFSPKLLTMLTKDKFKDFLSANNIRNAHYSKEIKNISQYPVVAKPVIGFGSIGVKIIANENALKYQLSEDKKNEMLSRINPYKEKYFKDENNFFIFEEYICGTFYRTPFIVYEKEIKYVFPVRGKNITKRSNSDFHWTDFEYGEQERIIAVDIKEVLNSLLDIFRLESGVYVAEFLLSEDGNLYVLELSPRQTSERISKLIQFSCGIDMEHIAVDIFFHDVKFMELTENTVRMQIQRTEKITQDENYKLIECHEEQSVHGDKVITVYSERV